MGDVIVTGAHNRAYACAEYCRMNNLPQLEEVFQECYDKIVELKEKIWEHEREDTWLPIDYTQAQSGKGCFDGKQHLVLINKKALCLARWDGSEWVLYIVVARPDGKVSTQMIHCNPSDVTHYRPVPAGWIGE